jgi:hypothetical protein
VQSLAVGLGRIGELGVPDGCPVASLIDGVHDGERAAYAEDEAHEESDDGRPVEDHDVSLLGACELLSAVNAVWSGAVSFELWALSWFVRRPGFVE